MSLTADAKTVKSQRRLMTLHQAASYLAISYSQARELVIYGHVASVRLPCPRAIDGRPMNRLLVDLADLDALIEKHRRNGVTG